MSQPQSCEKMYDLVDLLGHLYDDGIHILPGHFMAVRSKDLSRIVQNFPDAISDEIRDAHIILRKKDEILQDAMKKAERIVQDAENDRHRILSESNILRDIEEKAQKFRQEVLEECQDIKLKAFNEAEDVRLRASQDAIKIKDGAQDYAQNILTKLEGDLNQLYQVVMNGQQYLADVKSDDEYNQRMAAQ